MKTGFSLATLALFWLTGCASAPQLTSDNAQSPTADQAAALIAQARRAHGEAAFDRIRTITVEYDGEWSSLATALQPVLTDPGYRKQSIEKLVPAERSIVQVFTGPKGTKRVVRSPDKVEVQFNGVLNEEIEVRAAAALVADAYQLFLLGVFYLDRPGVTLSMAEPVMIEGRAHDQVLAVLRPGFGYALKDRVLFAIDRETKRLKRVRLTLEGLKSTQGAEVDVTFSDLKRIDGVWWPTRFVEYVRVPVDAWAHRWEVLELRTGR